MRTVFDMVSLLCLAIGVGGIVWCGDWRLLLSFPVAFGMGLFRDLMLPVLTDETQSTRMFLPREKFFFASHVFFSFVLVYMSGYAMLYFVGTPDDAIWTKACWFVGIVLQPWFWRWNEAREKVESVTAFALTIACAVMIVLVPKKTYCWFDVESLVLVAALIVENRVLKRKEVAA